MCFLLYKYTVSNVVEDRRWYTYADFLLDGLRDVLKELDRDLVALFFRNGEANFLGDALLHVDGILDTDRLGEVFALLLGDKEWNVFALLLRDFFALGLRDLLLHLDGNLLAMLLGHVVTLLVVSVPAASLFVAGRALFLVVPVDLSHVGVLAHFLVPVSYTHLTLPTTPYV